MDRGASAGRGQLRHGPIEAVPRLAYEEAYHYLPEDVAERRWLRNLERGAVDVGDAGARRTARPCLNIDRFGPACHVYPDPSEG